MKRKITQKEIKSFIADLGKLHTQSFDLGKKLCVLLERDPSAISQIVAANPNISKLELLRLEMVGRGKLHPGLYFSHTAGTARLSRMPISVQSDVIDNFVPVFSGGGKVVSKKAAELSPIEAMAVFDLDSGKIRNVDEQQEFIASNAKPQKLPRYRIAGDCLYVLQNPLKLTELEEIVAKMKKESLASLNSDMSASAIRPRPSRSGALSF